MRKLNPCGDFYKYGCRMKFLNLFQWPGKLKTFYKELRSLMREKNLLIWRINYLIDKLEQEELKNAVLQQKFLSAGNDYILNFENPQTFNEKIHWLRKNYLSDNPLTDMISDKFQFKSYITEKLGSDYIIPLIGKWENPAEIDWSALPQKFVLKSNWGGDGNQVLIVKNKEKLDIPATVRQLSEWLSPWGNPYCYAFTPIFKNLKPCIIAEEYVEQPNGQLSDYKFMCFNGEPRWILACSDRGHNTKYENHDMNWDLFIPSPNSAVRSYVPRPRNFDRMADIARKLSAPFPLVRVDFYEVEDKVYLGEMTFTPGGGFNTYYREWDLKLGSWLDLSRSDKKY